MEARLIASALRLEDFPPSTKMEIAFAGRSNVGKSSLLNSLIGRKNLAKVSKTPGKTQCINFYEVENKYYFVDLPGYGYARTSMALRQRWGVIIPDYLRSRKNLRCLLQLVDARHPPMPSDQELFDALQNEFRLPVIVVATKSDKINTSRKKQVLNEIKAHFKSTQDYPIVLFSSVTGEGKNAVWQLIRERLYDSKTEKTST